MSKIRFIITDDEGRQSIREVLPGSYTMGRDAGCDLVVSSPGVSRRHCRVVVEEGAVTVEDLGSSAGTFVGDEIIQGARRFRLPLNLGLAHLTVRIVPAAPVSAAAKPAGDFSDDIGMTLSARSRLAPAVGGIDGQLKDRLEMLYQLPLQFAAERDTGRLFDLILNRVMKLIPGAVRGALLLRDERKERLEVKASVPSDAPPVSSTLILRAVQEQSGFIWGDKEGESEDISASIASIRIRTGMFAPMLWKDETIGVLFVDNPDRKGAFTEDDLRFLISVAHYAASAVANQMLQNEIQENNKTLENLLANFSPKIRRRLLEKSRAGRLQPGGEKSDVTILLSDLRGFTKTSAAMDSEAVVEMLNDYFHVLGHEIFRHDGTIDKFIGDAILAVFGSPEPDPDHAHKATLAAIDMQTSMAAVNGRRAAAGLPVCELGIGVFTGEVLHGFIGSEDRLEYTVIGDTVNKASRYCDGAQGGQILLGVRTHTLLADRIPATPHTFPTKHEGNWNAFLVDWRENLGR
ncbi:MAG: adenylate/guanylate cyclase domain-containing protein [Spartobacteria bacterium]